MSKKASTEPAWAGLQPELLAIISDRLKEASHITRFRGVCRSWRSSVKPVPNILSSFFPHSLHSDCGISKSCPNHLIANVIYLVHPLNKPSPSFLLSLLESEAGKLLVRHPLSSDTIFATTGVDFSGWSLTRISISHCFSSDLSKVVIFDPNPDFPIRVGNSEAIALFCHQGMHVLRNCLSNTDYAKSVAGRFGRIDDFVNFNGCIYAVDSAAQVYVLHHTSTGDDGVHLRNFVSLRRLSLNGASDNGVLRRVSQLGKRFVVSDGDLYLVFNDVVAPGKSRHRCYIYRLIIMDGTNNATAGYSLNKVYSLGDRVFFINKDCSFSVSARELHLPSPLVGNHIFVGRLAFHNSDGTKGFYAYDGEGKPTRTMPAHSALFQPASSWIKQMQRYVSPKEKKKKKEKKEKEHILS